MEYKESTPDRVLVLIGTPITGKTVYAAMTPGKWAAPPAPAIIASYPFSMAEDAYSAVS
jgi:hypothetical protein